MGVSVLRAKLRPPELRAHHIPRPHLIRKLRSAKKRKLTLIVAGAGYGKSTLLAEWAQKNNRALWYSLDATDRDLAVFFAHLLAGLSELWPGFGRATEAILNQRVPPDPEYRQYLTFTLLDELESTVEQENETLLLVFDDYHRLGSTQAVDDVMEWLLERLPAGVQVIISSREPVSFSIARLRAARQVNQLTGVDLQFTIGEIQRLFEGNDLTEVALKHLATRTEGWVAGLELIRQALTYNQPLDMESFPSAPVDLIEGIYRYLTEEIFSRQPAQLQKFLLQSAILDELEPTACDEIFNRTDSAKWLTFLTKQGLFTIQLQRGPDIFRYHHLLTDYLRLKHRREVDTNEINEWHQQAANYYKNRQRWDEAFEHALDANAEELAAEVVMSAFQTMRSSGRFDTMLGWISRLSPTICESNPLLYSLRGHLLEDEGRHEQATGAFHQAIALAESKDDQPTMANAWSGLGIIAQRTGDLENSRSAWQKALDYAEGADIRSQFTALNGLAMVHYYSGQNRKSLELHQQNLDLAARISPSFHGLVMNNIGVTLEKMGAFTKAMHWYKQSLELRGEANQLGMVACLTNIGHTQTFLGEIEQARMSLNQAFAFSKELNVPLLLAYCLSNRGDLAAIEGDLSQAEELYQRSLEIKDPLHDSLGLVHTWTRLSVLRRRQGDLVEALACAQRAVELSDGGAVGLNERLPAQTALVLVWLEQGQIGLAVELLERVIDVHRHTTGNQYELTRCLWHLARAQRAFGKSGQEPLGEALALAERWNYRFLLTTLSQEHPDLLMEAVAAEIQPSLVAHLLSELGETAISPLSSLLEYPDVAVQIRAIEQLVDLGIEEAWKPLIEVSKKSKLTAVKKAARKALSALQLATPAPLHVTTLGEFTIRRGEKPIPNSAWVNRKAQTLFKILLAQEGKPVHRHDLINLLWPDELYDDPDEKYREETQDKLRKNLNQLVSRLRQVLEPYLPPRYPSRYLSTDGRTYRLELPEGSWVDDRAFEKAIMQARHAKVAGDSEDMLANYQLAADLYTGDHLIEERNEDWCLRRRDQLSREALEALYELADMHLTRNELEQAVLFAERLLVMEPWHEDGCYVLMKAYIELDKLEDARRVYHQCKEKLQDELGIAHSPDIDNLYAQI